MFVNEKKNKFSYYFLEILFIRFHKKLHTIHISDINSNPLFATQLTKIKSSYLPLFPLAPPCEENLARSTTAQSAHAIRPQHHRARNTQHTHPAHAPPHTQHPAHAPQTQKSAAYATLFLFIFT